jgi:hypothetical protein
MDTRGEAGAWSKQRRCLSGAGALMAVAAIAVTLLGGCGGSSAAKGTPTTAAGSSSGGSASGTPGGSAGQAVAFTNCMRSHGVTNFPDPNAQGSIQLPAGFDTTSSQYQAAVQACQSLEPAGAVVGQPPTAQQLSQALKFTDCMRANGVPTFPDPTPQGTFQGGAGGFDPKSPQFQTALRSCRTVMPAGSGFGSGH